MLTFAFEWPRRGDRGGLVVVLILQRENLERMKGGDPFDLQFSAYRNHWPIDRPARDIDLVIAYEEDQAAVEAFHRRLDMGGLMKYLERGRVYREGDAVPPRKL